MLSTLNKQIWLTIALLWCQSPCLVAQQTSPAQRTRFHHITMKDGLSNSWISDIHKDSRGFMWIATQYGLNRYDGTQIEYYTYDPENENGLSNNWVISISEDPNGNLWLGTYGKCLHKYDSRLSQFERLYCNEIMEEKMSINRIYSMHLDQTNNLWLASFDGQVMKYDIANDSLYSIDDLSGVHLLTIVEDDNIMWIGTDDGLFTYYTESKSFAKAIDKDYEIRALFLYGDTLMMATHNGLYSIRRARSSRGASVVGVITGISINDLHISEDNIWAATTEGLLQYNAKTYQKTWYHHDSTDPTSLVAGHLLSLEEDDSGNLWIGGDQGLCVLYKDQRQFEYEGFHPQMTKHQNPRAIISTDHSIWIGADDGLWKYSKYDHSTKPENIVQEPIRHLLRTKSDKVIASRKGNFDIYTIDPITGHYNKTQYENPDQVWFMQEDELGGIIMCAAGDLYYLDSGSKDILHLNPLLPQAFSDVSMYLSMRLDQNQRLWLGSTREGISTINWRYPDAPFSPGEAATYTHHPGDPNSITSNMIQYIQEDANGVIWIYTDGGINRYNAASNDFTRYSRSDGLIDDKVLAAAHDPGGYIWMSTISHGLLAWDSDTESGTFYREDDGLYHDAFLLHSAHRTEEGIMLFANEGGIQVFNPAHIKPLDQELPPLFGTKLKVSNQEVSVTSDGILQQSLEYTPQLDLNYNQNNLSLTYAIPLFGQSDKLKYRYQLQGGSGDWVSIPDLADISFANLNPGQYVLTVEACAGQYCRRSNPLGIDIHPPYWRSKLAYGLYLFIAIGTILLMYKLQIRRKFEKQERLQKELLQEAKIRFFANVTHEFRTPLTLIAGPLERIVSGTTFKAQNIRDSLAMVQDNVARLLGLVNNILDIGRLESGLMPVNLLKTNVPAFIRSILDNFQSYANSKEILIDLDIQSADFTCLMDRDKVQIILSNLLSNAIKFSAPKDSVRLTLSTVEAYYYISVSDQGKGIHKDELSKIFDRFYRIDSHESTGSGLGLSLVKELVDALNGRVEVTSDHGLGTTFRVRLPLLPITEEDPAISEMTPSNRKKLDDIKIGGDRHLILLVEDHDDVAQFIIEGLEDSFSITRSVNGIGGLKKAIDLVPDLIISDVMMPGMDGFTLCGKLKSHLITDHIPIILLTARADEASKMEGMTQGADAYLVKPFNDGQLKLVISNMLKTRDQLMSKIASLEKSHSNNNDAAQHPFIKKIMDTVSLHMGNPQFNVDFLCKELGMSRTQLHRKIKALTGESIMKVVNNIRFNKVIELLKDNSLTITEISYECGFSDPAYFSQVFAKRYGCSPTQYRTSLRKIH